MKTLYIQYADRIISKLGQKENQNLNKQQCIDLIAPIIEKMCEAEKSATYSQARNKAIELIKTL